MRLGEIYEKVESNKRKQIELEKMRMDFQRDLELQKKQVIERAQADNAKIRETDEEEEDHGSEDDGEDNHDEDDALAENIQRFPKFGAFHDECAKSSLYCPINKLRVGSVIDVSETETLAAKLGVFSKECELLFDESATSLAELCIKKMRFRALVDKLDKQTMLESENKSK